MISPRILLIALLVTAAASFAVALSVGSVSMGWRSLWTAIFHGGPGLQRTILLDIRLPRAAADMATRGASERLHLQVGDAAAVMAALAEDERPDVVYLDPTYPHRGKSALAKKEMRRLRAVVGEDADAPHLLAAALQKRSNMF